LYCYRYGYIVFDYFWLNSVFVLLATMLALCGQSTSQFSGWNILVTIYEAILEVLKDKKKLYINKEGVETGLAELGKTKPFLAAAINSNN
jgi:hypothetical protein